MIHRGKITGQNKRFGIVVAEFNEFITKRLLESALETLKKAGTAMNHIEVCWVPGALEVPYICQKLALLNKFDGIIALACILRGDTYHFECVSGEVTRGISQVALERKVPIASGIITADHLEQAIDRAGLKAGNKGAHAALAALEMVNLDSSLSKLRNKGKRNRKRVAVR